MALEPKFQDQILALERESAFAYLIQRDYKSLANLVKMNTTLAQVHGQSIVSEMYAYLSRDGVEFIQGKSPQGHQLTGDQLQVLAYARKADARVGEGVITVHFDYVARIEREGRGYQARFPDLEGTDVDEKKLTETEKLLEESLASYIGLKMLHGDTLPEPKYHGRKTKNVRPFKVQLTLADLLFEDQMTPEEAAKLQQAIHKDPGML